MAPAEAATPDWATVEDEAVSNMVYLVTFSALTHHGDAGPEHVLHGAAGAGELRDPDSLTREQVRDAVLDAVANPCSLGRGRRRSQPVHVAKLVVFEEKHDSDKKHFHVALKLTTHSRWVGFKHALRARHSLASHWSSSHTMFWSAVRYCHFTTPSKMAVDDSPLTWSMAGAPLNLHEESQEPFNAAALRARREKRERDAYKKAGEAPAKRSKETPSRITKLDFCALVLSEGLLRPILSGATSGVQL